MNPAGNRDRIEKIIPGLLSRRCAQEGNSQGKQRKEIGTIMLNTNFSEKFCKEGLTFDDVLLIPAA